MPEQPCQSPAVNDEGVLPDTVMMHLDLPWMGPAHRRSSKMRGHLVRGVRSSQLVPRD